MYIIFKLTKGVHSYIEDDLDYFVFDTSTNTTEIVSGAVIQEYYNYYSDSGLNVYSEVVNTEPSLYIGDCLMRNTILIQDGVFLLICSDNLGAVWYNGRGALVRFNVRKALCINFLVPLSVVNAEYFCEPYDIFLKRVMFEVT